MNANINLEIFAEYANINFRIFGEYANIRVYIRVGLAVTFPQGPAVPFAWGPAPQSPSTTTSAYPRCGNPTSHILTQ